MASQYGTMPPGRGQGPGAGPESRPPSAPAYAVTDISQVETYEAGPDGRPTLGYRVSFTTPSGTRASVFVPMSRYTPDNVRAEIMAQAHAVEQVHQIGT